MSNRYFASVAALCAILSGCSHGAPKKIMEMPPVIDIGDIDPATLSSAPEFMCVGGVLRIERGSVSLISRADFDSSNYYEKVALLYDVEQARIDGKLRIGVGAEACGRVSFNARCLKDYNDPSDSYTCVPVRLPIKVKDIELISVIE